MMKRWIRENESTIQLDNFLVSTPTSIQIIQPQTVNIAVKAEVTFYKMERSRLLRVLEKCSSEYRDEYVKELLKLVMKASKIEATTGDQELAELLAKAEAHLK